MTATPIIVLINPITTYSQAANIAIKIPSNNSKVIEKQEVKGTVKDKKPNIWVIIHPVGIAEYWVQPHVSLNKDGSWKSITYIGRSGNIDKNKTFEIIAVNHPKNKLKEGDVLSYWPSAKFKSQIIRVTRK